MSKEGGKVRFQREGGEPFYSTVIARVNDYFEKKKESPHANMEMILKSTIISLAYLILFLLLISGKATGVWLLATYSLFGVVQGLVGFNIAHDALHGAYSSSPKVNRWLGYFFDLNGESSLIWKMTHNGLHHTYTNIAGADEDIDKQWALRLSPHDPWFTFHRFQYLYTPILYGLVTLSWVFWGDWICLRRAIHEKKVSRKDLMIFCFFKAANITVMFLLPLIFSGNPLWLLLCGFLLLHFWAGITISIVFQLAHLVEGVEFPVPEEGIIREEWAIHEMRTTSNFATSNRILSWFLGGLNFQVEHHLFPRVCHVHYPKIQEIVKKTAEEMKVPYNEHRGFFSALASHIALLRKFGQKPSKQELSASAAAPSQEP